MSVKFHNKTDKIMSVHLDECFLIVNGLAYKYFMNRTIATSVEKSTTKTRSLLFENYYFPLNSRTLSTETTVSFSEEKIIAIPPGAAKMINIANSISTQEYKNCNLKEYPKAKEGKSTITFDNQSSPYKFSNSFSYSVADKDSKTVLKHDFFVNEIINYNQNQMFMTKRDTLCGKTSKFSTKTMRYLDIKNFYISYNKVIN